MNKESLSNADKEDTKSTAKSEINLSDLSSDQEEFFEKWRKLPLKERQRIRKEDFQSMLNKCEERSKKYRNIYHDRTKIEMLKSSLLSHDSLEYRNIGKSMHDLQSINNQNLKQAYKLSEEDIDGNEEEFEHYVNTLEGNVSLKLKITGRDHSNRRFASDVILRSNGGYDEIIKALPYISSEEYMKKKISHAIEQ